MKVCLSAEVRLSPPLWDYRMSQLRALARSDGCMESVMGGLVNSQHDWLGFDMVS